MIDDLAGGFIEAGAELRERFQFLELRVSEFEVAGDRPIGGSLRRSAHARNRLADVHRGGLPQFEQRGRQVDLTVRDGDEIGWDVGGDILRLGLDDGKRGERTTASLLAEMRRPFQHPRMNVEDVTGKRFAPGRTTEQEGKLAIGARMHAA